MDSDDDLRGLIGLQNLGNTCYMNAALQALSNCQKLTRFVLDCPSLDKESGLSRCYSELINEIWNPQNSQYAVPTSIIRNIKCTYPAFRGCTQQDSQEFLRCFLEQLHDELKRPTVITGTSKSSKKLLSSSSNSTLSSSTCDACENEGDEENDDDEGDGDDDGDGLPNAVEESGDLLATYADTDIDNSNSDQATKDDPSAIPSQDTSNHSSDSQQQQQPQQQQQQQQQQQPRSIISDTFDFKISSSIVCSSCNNISTTKETFKDLSVPIPSRDHPYYQQQQQQQQQQLQETDVSGQSPTRSTTSNRSTASSLLNGECDKVTPSKESSPDASNSDDASNRDDDDEDEDDDNDEDDTDESSGKELQTTSYIDSIPLARWFINWFSQLGSWFWGPQVTLHDCLSVFFGTDPLEGENEYSCEICTKKNRGVKYMKIMQLPEVLCIHFKRYESVGSAKITTHVSFPLTGLDLAPFMCPNSEPQDTTYDLFACICHHGSALLTGHYTTYALNCYDDQWYEFDDQYVTCVSSYQVENSEAYILFYQKSTTQK